MVPCSVPPSQKQVINPAFSATHMFLVVKAGGLENAYTLEMVQC